MMMGKLDEVGEITQPGVGGVRKVVWQFVAASSHAS